jgi:hypothetical protein
VIIDGIQHEVVARHNNRAEEFSRLVAAYSYTWQQELREEQFQIFNEFFKRWDTFSHVYLYVRNSVKTLKVPQLLNEKPRQYHPKPAAALLL